MYYWLKNKRSYCEDYVLLPGAGMINTARKCDMLLQNVHVRSSHRRCSYKKAILKNFAEL